MKDSFNNAEPRPDAEDGPLEELVKLRASLAKAEAASRASEAGRRQAEDALAWREQLYHLVVGVVSEGIVVHNERGVVETANQAARDILGLSLGQMIGREPLDPNWQLLSSESVPLSKELVPSEITRTTGRALQGQVLGVRRGTGEQAWLRVSTEPLLTRENRVSGVVSTFADVTNERRAVLALEHSRAQFQGITDAIPGVLYQYERVPDGKDRFTFLGPQAIELLGVSSDVAMENVDAFWDLVSPEDRAEALRTMDETHGAHAVWEHDLRIRQGGLRFWIRARAISQPGESGTIWNGVIIDVTEEHRLAEHVRHVQRREAMGDLAAGVAHNFNNVLAAILPNLEECRTAVPKEMLPALEDSLKAARTGADLVRQLLQVTRRDPQQTPKQALDVVQVVREVARLCKRSFNRRVRISTVYSVNEAAALIHASELHQILLNLCINARDAMNHSREPELTIGVGQQPSELRREYDDVVITVSDNGVGMDLQTRRRLGEPFFTTKPPGKGTGLGLATAFSILRDRGAHMTCDSAVGEGTTFRIRLPGVPATSVATPVPSVRAPEAFDGERILVVDDEPLVRRAIERKLKVRGLQPTPAADGFAALELLRSGSRPFDAMLLDLSMPRLSGEEVLQRVSSSHRELPVIVLTGHIPEGVSLSSARAVLVKPIADNELFSVLRSALLPPSAEAPVSG